MICSACGAENPEDSRFCNQCGTQLEQPVDQHQVYYGVFTRGGYGDGYNTSFRFTTTIPEALKWQNSPASLSVNNPERETFLAEISAAELQPTDATSYITSRWTVHHWWKLIWNGTAWEVGEELSEHPTSIGLSPLENG